MNERDTHDCPCLEVTEFYLKTANSGGSVQILGSDSAMQGIPGKFHDQNSHHSEKYPADKAAALA